MTRRQTKPELVRIVRAGLAVEARKNPICWRDNRRHAPDDERTVATYKKGVKKMKILEKIYTKYFDSKEKAEAFIDSHKIQKNFVLSWDYVGGLRWIVEKYKNWAD